MPSLTALLMFEATARHGSFTKAADELSVTESAVFKQVAALEERCRVKLFHRTKRRLALTADGMEYAHQVRDHLRGLEKATQALHVKASGKKIIELASVPTFASQWLLPKLADFLAKSPNIIVNIHSRVEPFSLNASIFDAAIYSGSRPWESVEGRLILNEGDSVIVASPAMASRVHATRREDYLDFPLLHLESRTYSWQDWIYEGQQQYPPVVGQTFDLFYMLIRAAVHDAGLALVPRIMVEEELRRGQLVCIEEVQSRDHPFSKYFVSYRSGPLDEELEKFLGWISSIAEPATDAERVHRKDASGTVQS